MIATDLNDSRVNRARLSYAAKILYGAGEMANAIKVVTFALYSLFFATVVLGLPGMWIGIAAFVTMFWDGAIDPCIGYLTDQTGASSRRYTFMLIGALTMGFGFWAFFSPPLGLPAPALLAWLLAASFVVRTATSMYSIPYYALGANLSGDYHERTSITAIRGMAGVVGTSLTASLSFVLFFRERVPGVDPKLRQAGYASMGIVFGLIMAVVALIGLFGSQRIHRRVAAEPIQMQQSPAGFFRSMWESLRHQSFRVMVISFSLVVVAQAINSSLFLHYLTYYVKVRASLALSSSQLAFFGGGILGTLFFLQMSKRYDKHRLFVFSSALTSVLLVSALLLFGEGHLLGTGDVRPLLIGYGAAGFLGCILWFVPQSMLADVADESEWITGRRQEGALFGVLSFCQQVAVGLAVMLAGGLLDRFVKLVPGAAHQSATAAHRIGMVYSLVPAALFLGAAIMMQRYKLTRFRVVWIQEQLHHRRDGEFIVPASQLAKS